MADNSNNDKESSAYRNYVLVMLTIVYVFNFVDRQILVILQESIKTDLNLSDTQLGLLSGFTFAIFYVTMGIPIARLADRSNRRNIVAVSLALWSAMTTVSGLVQNYTQLLLARIGVGVGEAGGSPPAHAMISDYFPQEKRATALSFYSTGIYLGVLIGFLMGGFLNQHFGWRTSFLVLGIPGIVFAIFFYFTVREPLRGASEKTIKTNTQYSIKEVFQVLLAKRSFVYLACATGLHTFCTYGLGNWIPSFLFRIHNMTSVQIGIWLGIIIGIGGGIGTIVGGYLADRLGRSNKQWYFKVSAFAAALAFPFAVMVFFLDNTTATLISLCVVYVLYTMFLGPSIAITHTMVPLEMRALSSAILFFVLNLIGLGFGPLVVGFISDLLSPTLGAESLRWALAVTLPVSALAIFMFIKAGQHIDKDLAGQ